MRKLPFLLLCLLLPGSAIAWEDNLSVDYVLSDGDSRISAKAHALEALRVKASERTETYIQTSTTLSGSGSLSKTIEVIGASMVEIADYHQEFHMNAEGRTVVVATANVSVDERALEDRIQALQNNAAKQRKIRRLAAENARLRIQLAQSRVGAVSGYASLVDSLGAETDTLVALSRNRDNVNALFQPGTLMGMAKVTDILLDSAKRSLQRRVLDQLSTPGIQAIVKGVTPDREGYTVLVGFEGEINMTAIETALDQWFEVERDEEYVKVLNPNRHGRTPPAATRHLFDWLAQHQLMLHVSIEGVGAEIPVFYVSENGLGGQCEPQPQRFGRRALREKEGFAICVAALDEIGEHFIGTDLMYPLRFHLTEEQTENASAVESEIRVETL